MWKQNLYDCSFFLCTRWFKYDRDYLCVNKSQFVPVIFEPPCTSCPIKRIFGTVILFFSVLPLSSLVAGGSLFVVCAPALDCDRERFERIVLHVFEGAWKTEQLTAEPEEREFE
jgi:hypothetical protein